MCMLAVFWRGTVLTVRASPRRTHAVWVPILQCLED